MSKIETDWLPVSHLGLQIRKICLCVTPDILFHTTDLAIMQYFRDN